MNATLKKLPDLVFDTLCIACWMIWNCHNKLVFDSIVPIHKDLWSRVDLYRLEFLEVQQKNVQIREFTAAKLKPLN